MRLPLNQDCWLGTRGAPVSDQYEERTVEGYREEVQRFVTALNDEGLVVVLDLHSRKRIGQPEFGNLAMPDSESIAFWTSVAGAYAANPSVMFDAFNEPYSRYNSSSTRFLFDLTWKCWRDGGCEAPFEDDQTRHGRPGDLLRAGHGRGGRRDPRHRRRAADPARRSRLRQRPRATGWSSHPTTTS